MSNGVGAENQRKLSQSGEVKLKQKAQNDDLVLNINYEKIGCYPDIWNQFTRRSGCLIDVIEMPNYLMSDYSVCAEIFGAHKTMPDDLTDECIVGLALKNGDLNGCYNAKYQHQYCYLFVAYGNSKITSDDCTISGKMSKSCVVGVAIREQDPKICNLLHDDVDSLSAEKISKCKDAVQSNFTDYDFER